MKRVALASLVGPVIEFYSFHFSNGTAVVLVFPACSLST